MVLNDLKCTWAWGGYAMWQTDSAVVPEVQQLLCFSVALVRHCDSDSCNNVWRSSLLLWILVTCNLTVYISSSRFNPSKVRSLALRVKSLLTSLETRHLVEGPFGSEFPAICNHCGVMTTWSRKTCKFWAIFAFFLEKMTPYGKIFKILYPKFSPPHQSPLSWNVVKCFRWEIGKIVCYLPDKNTKFRLPLKLLLLCGSRRKSARASPQHLAHSVPDFIQIGSVSVEMHFPYGMLMIREK